MPNVFERANALAGIGIGIAPLVAPPLEMPMPAGMLTMGKPLDMAAAAAAAAAALAADDELFTLLLASFEDSRPHAHRMGAPSSDVLLSETIAFAPDSLVAYRTKQ